MQTIDLNGPNGNAFYILATARKLAADLDMDADAITLKMRSGDYRHLCAVFTEHFGNYVKLEGGE